MGSSCGKEISTADVGIPEGLVELKKQRQFSEYWKRKYDVSLTCFFTTVSRLSSKSVVPGLKGCTGVIVVRISITCKVPSRSNLNSILHTPVLQWHGPDVKFQFPKFLPLNLWEGEHTVFAVYQSESTGLTRGYCTVTAKIGQEEILLEEELRSDNAVSLAEVTTLSSEFEKHLDKLPVSVKKKHKQSGGRNSLRESRDTGYTSERAPYPALRYSEQDTDSDHEEEKRQKEKRYKLRRKDTPSCFGKPPATDSPKISHIPLIEELEMNQGSSPEQSEGESNMLADTSLIGEHIERNLRQTSATPKKSVSIRDSPLLELERTSKRSSRSSWSDTKESSDDRTTVAIAPIAEKSVARQSAKRKKKSITSRLVKEKALADKAEQVAGAEADDADDEDEHASKKQDLIPSAQEIVGEHLSARDTATIRQDIEDSNDKVGHGLDDKHTPNRSQQFKDGRESLDHELEEQANMDEYTDEIASDVQYGLDVPHDPTYIVRSVGRTSSQPTSIIKQVEIKDSIKEELAEENNELTNLETKDKSDSETKEKKFEIQHYISGSSLEDANKIAAVEFTQPIHVKEDPLENPRHQITATSFERVRHEVDSFDDKPIASVPKSDNKFVKVNISKRSAPEDLELLGERGIDMVQNSQGRGKSESFSCTTKRIPSPMKHSLSSELGSPKITKSSESVPPLSPKKPFCE